jgi:hypothetical protein
MFRLTTAMRLLILTVIFAGVALGNPKVGRASDPYVYVKFGDGTCTPKSIAFPLYYNFNTYDHVVYHQSIFLNGVDTLETSDVPVRWWPGTGTYTDNSILYNFPATTVPYQVKVTYVYTESIDPTDLNTAIAFYQCGTDGIAHLTAAYMY